MCRSLLGDKIEKHLTTLRRGYGQGIHAEVVRPQRHSLVRARLMRAEGRLSRSRRTDSAHSYVRRDTAVHTLNPALLADKESEIDGTSWEDIMGRAASRLNRLPQETRNALSEYLAELEKAYPEGMSKCQIVPWPEYGEGSYLVKVLPPHDEERWIQLSEQMAEVGTRILVDSDQFFILTI
ncbi:MAG: hypothetical protein ACRD2L_25640 [Terriglobia bacterium]